MRTIRCPYCDEPLAPHWQRCPLCGEIVQSPAAAAIATESSTSDPDALKGMDIFLSAMLEGAQLRGAMLGGADLFDADLSNADLRGADLSRALLSSANLSCADLTGANLWGADLSQANLCGADFTRAVLIGVNLEGARYDRRTVFPSEFDPHAAGAVNVPD